MPKVRDVTKEEEDFIKDNLRYDPETGYLWWTKRASGRSLDKPAGGFNQIGYIVISRRDAGVKRNYFAHRLAWFIYHGIWPKEQVDHINNVKDDNRIVNLREATGSENQANQKPQVGCSSRYKGVYWNKQICHWRAKIKVNKKPIHLGCYDNEEEAALAYNKAALEHFGEYAKINDVTP
jgi:hypothetical protein